VYSTLLFSPATQSAAPMEKMDWNSLMRSSRLHVAPVVIPVVLQSLSLFCFIESRISFKDVIYVIIILYICDIWLSVSTFGRMCGTIDPGSCIQ
jgi:hypothetical protein